MRGAETRAHRRHQGPRVAPCPRGKYRCQSSRTLKLTDKGLGAQGCRSKHVAPEQSDLNLGVSGGASLKFADSTYFAVSCPSPSFHVTGPLTYRARSRSIELRKRELNSCLITPALPFEPGENVRVQPDREGFSDWPIETCRPLPLLQSSTGGMSWCRISRSFIPLSARISFAGSAFDSFAYCSALVHTF